MFLYQKFLEEKKITHINPIPLSKGFVVYEYYEEIPRVEIISFFWETMRGCPNRYSFRYSKLIRNIVPNECYIDHSCQYVNWDRFFETWSTIKNNLNSKNNLKIAKNLPEAKNLIWKSFIFTQESYLYKHVHNLPSCFFNSLDNNIDTFDRLKNQEAFILHIKSKMPYVYSSWISFFETNIDEFFCYWFNPYCQQHETENIY
jgi:hypothetical protein